VKKNNSSNQYKPTAKIQTLTQSQENALVENAKQRAIAENAARLNEQKREQYIEKIIPVALAAARRVRLERGRIADEEFKKHFYEEVSKEVEKQRKVGTKIYMPAYDIVFQGQKEKKQEERQLEEPEKNRTFEAALRNAYASGNQSAIDAAYDLYGLNEKQVNANSRTRNTLRKNKDASPERYERYGLRPGYGGGRKHSTTLKRMY
jgi:hypothetical protein